MLNVLNDTVLNKYSFYWFFFHFFTFTFFTFTTTIGEFLKMFEGQGIIIIFPIGY